MVETWMFSLDNDVILILFVESGFSNMYLSFAQSGCANMANEKDTANKTVEIFDSVFNKFKVGGWTLFLNRL